LRHNALDCNKDFQDEFIIHILESISFKKEQTHSFVLPKTLKRLALVGSYAD
jgi:hypothetical protein